ncbi:MAG: alpha-amylase family glycosyl hydrolase, partial [Gammaproteobacteria bacterium]|nr:alpha-amylase family glycosyl hydrolase [Gammaproteobacteria bacterium]
QICGVADQGNDNSEAFGAELFARGEYNEWANNPAPGPPYLFVNFGAGIYRAEFDMQAGSYDFKLADGDWTVVEYARPGETVIIGEQTELPGVVPDGGPSSTVVIAEDGCYSWELAIIDASMMPAPLAELTVRLAGVSGSEIRAFDSNDIQVASFSGTTSYELMSVGRAPGEPGITLIEVAAGLGDTAIVAVDDFVFTPITDDNPATGDALTGEALLSGFNLMPPVDSFGTGLATVTVDDVSGAISGQINYAGLDATAVVIRFSGSAIVALIQDATDPGLWRIPDGTTLNAAELQAYLNGELEIVVITVAHTDGEIGGRLLPAGVVLLPDNGAIADRSPRDEIIYFVMTDRFFNGDSTNDNGNPPGVSSGGYNAFSTATWHGGDFVGLSAKLDYLQGLGVTAIWVTPPVANSGPNAYHGYWAVDFENIDPHLGTNAEYQAFIDAAHARGIKVYQDAVINHTADIITYAEGQFTYRPLTEPPYTPVVPPEWVNAKNPAWLNDTQYYHNRGNSTFSGESSIYGDFFGLDDVATEIPFVRQQFIDIFQGWVGDFGVDGFRMDTAKHVRMDFWNDFAPALEEFALGIGKDNLTIFGESFDGNAVLVSEFFTRGEMPSMLNFPLHFAIPGAFSRTNRLDEIFDLDDRFTDADSDARDLVNFFGNHDIGRAGGIIRSTLPGLNDDDQVAAVSLAYAMNFFLRGVPTIYYGDEQGFPGDGGDQGAREDMLSSQVPSYNDNDLIGTEATTADDNFDQSHPLYRNFSRYSEVFKQHPALRRGLQVQRFSRGGPGLYVASRVQPHDRMEYLVAFNTATGTDTATVTTNTSNATWYGVWPPAQAPLSSGANGAVSLSVPGRSFAIYRSDTAMPDPAPVISLDFPNLAGGSQAEGLIEVLTDLNTSDFVRVWFETSVDGGPFELAGEDYTAPFRLYWDSNRVAGPAVVTMRANVLNPAGDTTSTEVDLIIDNRQISTLTVQYENGNNRSELVLIDEAGEVIGPKTVAGSEAIEFPLNSLDGALTLIYQDRDGDEFTFDRPIFVDFATQLLLATDDGNNLVLDLYINNEQVLDNQPNFLGSGNPPALPFDLAAPAPFGTTELFVRGSFNNWSLENPLNYTGNYTYHTVLEDVSGELYYKIADENWSSVTDFGGPYTDAGLSVGAGVPDLADTVATGSHDFYFFSVPDGPDVVNFHEMIQQPDPGANNPYGVTVFVRGSFNTWGLTHPMDYNETTSTFSATLILDAASHEFKISSEDWSTADFGGDGVDDIVVLGAAKTLVRSSNNLHLAIDTAGDYDFSVDASVPLEPVLTVIPSP